MNIDPELWGKHGWFFLHYTSLGYPKKPSLEDKKYYRQFIESLAYILPCESCRNHFHQNLKYYNMSDVLSSRKNIFEFFVDMHNKVNKKNKKRLYTYEEVYKYFDSQIKKEKKVFNYIGFIIILLIIFYGFGFYRK